ASSELSCFDSYLLATNVAQFPLPVISGIGHERDFTVLDMVAHTRAKTPTAVAEFLISRLTLTATELLNLEERVVSESESRLLKEQTDLFSLSKDLVHQSSFMIQRESAAIQQFSSKLKYGVRHQLQQYSHQLENWGQFIQMVSPVNILKRGYTLTLKNGKIVTSLRDLSVDDVVETRFRDGFATSVVTKMEKMG
ncbi:MAG: exodeoxyribonuclease VII large subunit, partial [Bacteroidales bacterium]|nr:exodeoxyribonuclease VII large subunit [Bacteroidales bacterium]